MFVLAKSLTWASTCCTCNDRWHFNFKDLFLRNKESKSFHPKTQDSSQKYGIITQITSFNFLKSNLSHILAMYHFLRSCRTIFLNFVLFFLSVNCKIIIFPNNKNKFLPKMKFFPRSQIFESQKYIRPTGFARVATKTISMIRCWLWSIVGHGIPESTTS